jgi:tRNA threonylcarbamoyl adenosine modification protein YeaZ
VLFLGIDTATSGASLALARADGVIREDRLTGRGAHARDLLVRLESLFAATDGTIGDLRGIGVTEGPGSFTGVRVGMATAKGLAYALDVPLVGLSTLEALARAARRAAGALPAGVAAVLDAGRGEVYAARFRIAGEDPDRLEEDRAWRPADLLAALPAGMPLVGDGARVLEAPAAAIGRPLVILDPGPPLAGVVALRAAALAGSGQRYRPGTLRPNYIRPSDAEAARAPVRKE